VEFSHVILDLSGPEELVERLRELGFSPGEKIEILRQFPFRGPWVLMTAQGMVALRNEEFQCLKIQKKD
jgi:Fe2+ transport system protein FeoA